MADPIKLSAEARPVIQQLHGRGDIVVRFKTNRTGFREDALNAIDEEMPGHFNPDNIVMEFNLDKLVNKAKPLPEQLATVEDFRKYPVLTGVVAHESARARFSLWGTRYGDPIPSQIENPDYDPTNPFREVTKTRTEWDEHGVATEVSETTQVPVPEFFSVAATGKMVEVANLLEDARVERLGSAHFSKTWKSGLRFSSGHFIMTGVDEDDEDGKQPLEAALALAIRVGGRVTAGTLGHTVESRASVKKVLDSVRDIIETALKDNPEAHPEPFEAVMGIINRSVFSNAHTDPLPHIEDARQILKILYPQSQDDPDSSGSGSGGSGEEEGSGGGAGMPGEGMSPEVAEALADMLDEAKEGIDSLSREMSEMVESEENDPGGQRNNVSTGHGSVLYKNPRAPQVAEYVDPTAEDRELYRRARDWMERQIEPTVTSAEVNQWLPVGGARLDVRSYVRDNLAGHKGQQRTDWTRVSETTKPSPPVKVAIMLDGSGSMGAFARPSASIAWAAANAAADLPESRTVSVVYGNAAQVTQQPGHAPARQLAISNTNGGTEEFIDAAELVEDALWLNEEVEEGQRSNVLIIIVSDLQYGGVNQRTRKSQSEGFIEITQRWADKGYKIMVVGTNGLTIMRRPSGPGVSIKDLTQIEVIDSIKELFR